VARGNRALGRTRSAPGEGAAAPPSSGGGPAGNTRIEWKVTVTDEQLHRKVEGLEEELSALRGELGKLVEAALQGARDAQAETGYTVGDVPPGGEADVGDADAAGASTASPGGESRAQAVHDEVERDVETAVRVGKRALQELNEAARRHPTGSLAAAFVAGLVLSRLLGLGHRE